MQMLCWSHPEHYMVDADITLQPFCICTRGHQSFPSRRCSTAQIWEAPQLYCCKECTGNHRHLMHLLGPDLVANKLDAAVLHCPDSWDIKVCQPQVLDGAPLLLICKPLGGGQIIPLAVVLPVKLHKVQRWGANALEGLLNGLQAGQSALEAHQELPGRNRPVEGSCPNAMHAAYMCISTWKGGMSVQDRSAQMCMHCQHTALL